MSLFFKPITFGARHGQILLVFFTVKLNLNIAIVSMANTSSPSGNDQVFNWTSSQRGVLLGTFFYGYIASNPPSGLMANRLPTRILLSISSVISGLITVLFPVIASQSGFVGCCVARAILGVFQGLALPCTSAHLAKWAAAEERAPFFAFAYCGTPLGGASITLLAGYLADSSGGWPSIFYVSGSLSLLWGLALFWFLRDSPTTEKNISVHERIFLEKNQKHTSDKGHSLPIPWIGILKSFPLWTAVITGFGHNWGIWTLGTMLPSYMKATFGLDMKQNGLYSSIPYFGMAAACIIGPMVEQFTSRRFHFPLNTSRKIWTSIAEYGSAVCLAIIGFAHPEATAVVILLFIAEFSAVLAHLGYMCSPMDLSPNFVGILMGILNGMSQIAALLAPTLIGFMLHGDGTPFEWSVVFILSAGIMALGGSVYNFLGSAEVQPWNSPQIN